MKAVNNGAIRSNEELENLTTSNVKVIAAYAFQNPDSINGPFGTLDLTLSEDPNHALYSSGDIKINTLFGLGSLTNLKFTAPAKFDGSTGYTTIKAEAHGTIVVRPNPPRAIKTAVEISLAPGLHTGTMSVEGFFHGYQIKATAIHYGNE